MASEPTTVNLPNVTVTLDQFIDAIRQLDQPARIQVAQALLATEMDSKLAALIERLAKHAPTDDVGDDVINAEVSAVRRARAQSSHA